MKTLEQLQAESKERNKDRYIKSLRDNLSIIGIETVNIKKLSVKMKPKLKYDPKKMMEFIKRKMAS